MEVNMMWDGLFHPSVWGVTLAGVFMIWGAARRGDAIPSLQAFVGQLILGWGLLISSRGAWTTRSSPFTRSDRCPIIRCTTSRSLPLEAWGLS